MPEHTIQRVPSPGDTSYSKKFWDKDVAVSRKTYLRTIIGGSVAIIIAIFAVLSIYWGALWKTPNLNLQGWVVDFDGGIVGQSVVRGLTAGPGLSTVTFTSVPATEFPGGALQVANAVVEQHTWVAVIINGAASDHLKASYINPNSSYNGAEAITVYAGEARNENAFRSLIRPSIQATLEIVSQSFALQSVKNVVSSTNISNILTVSPQTVLVPISYTFVNLVPFDKPVATAVTFVGLIYAIILSFFVVTIANVAREVSGLNKILSLRSLIITRFVSTFAVFFFVSLFYSLLSLAFQLDFSRKFGHGGFVIFWMLNWVGMLSVGLALESVITLLTMRFIPFFLLVWIITNVSVCIFPIEVLPVFFRYGYAMPFYNISHAARCIVFGTRNQLGQNFGILLIWTVISCLSLPFFQWLVRRNEVMANAQARELELERSYYAQQKRPISTESTKTQ